MSALAGKKILIVEDEFLIALTAEMALSGLGATVVGPSATVAAAIAAIESQPLDAALIDVNLNGEDSGPIARALGERGVPFVIATGYGAAPWGPSAAVLNKPYSEEDLARELTRVLGP